MSSEAESFNVAFARDTTFREKSYDSFPHFVNYTMPEYEMNWHHLLLMKKLEKLERGEIKNLMVFMPPRHGKSELVSRRFPAWYLGRNPDAAIIACSYAMDLAAKMNRDVQRIMAEPKYQTIFPEVKLGTGKYDTKNDVNYLKNTHIFEVRNHKGIYRAAGVGTGITGMGFDLGIIDDPVKDMEQAVSEVYRDKCWEWFLSTFETRAQKNAKKLITMTRWHEDDLCGRILKAIRLGEEGWEDYDVLELPGLATEDGKYRDMDEALWHGHFPTEKLLGIKARSLFWFNALYQQKPTDPGGNIVKREWLNQRFTCIPDNFDEVMQSWDTSYKNTKGSDFAVGQVWGRKGSSFYLLDQVRARMDFTELLTAIERLTAKWPIAHLKVIEDTANGPAVISALKQKIAGIVPYTPDVSKEARLYAVSMYFEAGNVWLPDASIAPWINDYVEELTSFPKGSNDDQVDATTQALLRFQNEAGGEFTDSMLEEHETIAGSLLAEDQW